VLALTLNWRVEELAQMLTKRLDVFSNGKVSSLSQLVAPEVDIDLHRMVAHLAGGSPRDAIRLAKWIVSEQTRTGTKERCLGALAIWQGIRGYADELALELSGPYLRDLKRVAKPTFTLNYLANDALHLSTQAARNKVQNWMNAGVVARLGDAPNPRNRGIHLYGIVDVRVVLSMMSATEVPLVLGNYAVECPGCSRILVTAESAIDCPHCGRHFALSEGRSLLEVCAHHECS
jgi:hypothetical protein